MYVYVHKFARSCVHVCSHIFMCICPCIYVYMYICLCTLYVYVCICERTYMCVTGQGSAEVPPYCIVIEAFTFNQNLTFLLENLVENYLAL